MTARSSLLLTIGVLALAALAGTAWLLHSGRAPGPVPTEVAPPAAPDEPLPDLSPLDAAPPPTALLGDASDHPVEPIDKPGAVPALIEGRVIDRAGQAVPGATLTLLTITDEMPFRSRALAGLLGAAEADGNFRLVGAPVGTSLGLEVEHPDYAPVLRETFAAEAGKTTALGDIVLESGMTVNGTILDPEGSPIAGASVSLRDVATLHTMDAAAPPLRTVTSDDQGQYALPHMALRQYEIEARAEGFVRATTVLSLVLGTPSGAWTQDFHLLAADSELAGTVLDPDERPVPGASVRVSQRQQGTYFLDNATTGPDGRFRFADLAAGRYQVEILDSAFYLPQPVELPAGTEGNVVHVQRALAVHGQLQAEGGLPDSFHVTVHPDGRSGAGLVGNAPIERTVNGSTPPGAFVCEGLRPGSYRFEISAAGFADTTSADVIIGPDSTFTEVLIPLLRGGTLVGRLSEPLAGVRADLRGDDYDPSQSIESTFPTPPIHGLSARTDAQGAFRIEHVPAGAYTLTALPPGSPPLHARSLTVVDEQTTDAGTLTLLQGAVIFGNVDGPDGRPRPGVRIAAQGREHQQQAVTDAQGAFRMEALPPGDYDLTASPGNLWEALRFDAHQSVTVRAGEERPVLLTLAERQPQPPH